MTLHSLDISPQAARSKRWLDIADELGLMVIYEFPLWALAPVFLPHYKRALDRQALRQQMSDWLRDAETLQLQPAFEYYVG